MRNYPQIHWTEQCNYCTRGLNTTYCARNQQFMQNLNDLDKGSRAIGSLDFVCDYFVFDEVVYKKDHPAESASAN